MTSQKPLPNDFALPRWFYGVIIFIVTLIIYLFLLANGQIRYMEAYIKCGWQKPILAETGLQIDGGKNTDRHYTLPSEGYHLPKAADIYGSSAYYCSEDAAIADGYTHK